MWPQARLRRFGDTIRDAIRGPKYEPTTIYRLYRGGTEQLSCVRENLRHSSASKVPEKVRYNPQYANVCKRCLAMTSTVEGLKALTSRSGYRRLRLHRAFRVVGCPLCAFIDKQGNEIESRWSRLVCVHLKPPSPLLSSDCPSASAIPFTVVNDGSITALNGMIGGFKFSSPPNNFPSYLGVLAREGALCLREVFLIISGPD